jgi:hypothetical protein
MAGLYIPQDVKIEGFLIGSSLDAMPMTELQIPQTNRPHHFKSFEVEAFERCKINHQEKARSDSEVKNKHSESSAHQ